MSTRLLIGIVDLVAHTIVGTPQLFTNEVVAIRHFDDVMKDPQPNMVNSHKADMEMRKFGQFDDDTLEFTTDHTTIMTGKQWLAQQPQEQA